MRMGMRGLAHTAWWMCLRQRTTKARGVRWGNHVTELHHCLSRHLIISTFPKITQQKVKRLMAPRVVLYFVCFVSHRALRWLFTQETNGQFDFHCHEAFDLQRLRNDWRTRVWVSRSDFLFLTSIMSVSFTLNSLNYTKKTQTMVNNSLESKASPVY